MSTHVNMLQQWLASSWVFQHPLKWLQQLESSLQQGLLQSHAVQALQRLFNRSTPRVPLPFGWQPEALVQYGHGPLLALGLAGLMAVMTVADTGPIGAMVWGLFAWYWGIAWVTGRSQWLQQLHWGDVLVHLFFATYLISASCSSVQPYALQGLGKVATFWAAYTVWRGCFAQYPQAVGVLMAWLVCLGLGQTALGAWQWLHPSNELATWTDPSTLPEHQLMRVYGTLKPLNPNLLAGYLLACMGAGVWLVGHLGALGLKRTWPWVLLALMAVLALVAGVGMTGSRGGYLGVACIGLLSFLWAYPILTTDPVLKRHDWLKVVWLTLMATAVAGLSLILASSEALQHRLLSMFSFREDSSISYRLNVYSACWRMFLDNWLVGIGPSNLVFKPTYGLYMVPGFNALGAYSVPLEIAVEQGLIGLTAFVILIKSMLTTTALQLHDTRIQLTQKLWLGGIGIALLGFVFHGFFDTIWYRPSVQVLFWFFVAAWVTVLPRMPHLPCVPHVPSQPTANTSAEACSHAVASVSKEPPSHAV